MRGPLSADPPHPRWDRERVWASNDYLHVLKLRVRGVDRGCKRGGNDLLVISKEFHIILVKHIVIVNNPILL